jgi:transcriptional regulator GlxA family with amidase domain
LAAMISDQFNHPKIRRQDDAQRMLPEARFGISNAKLSFVIRRMEASLDQPISIADLADSINLSARQLERLFVADLGKTPQKFYIELRMTRARDLLLQSSLSIGEVAGICGYASSSHFGRFYRQQFNESPVETRRLDQIGRMGMIQPGAHRRNLKSGVTTQ